MLEDEHVLYFAFRILLNLAEDSRTEMKVGCEIFVNCYFCLNHEISTQRFINPTLDEGEKHCATSCEDARSRGLKKIVIVRFLEGFF